MAILSDGGEEMEKAELETVIKTTSKHNSLNQTIIKYWTLDGEFLFEKLYGEVQKPISADEYQTLSNVVK